MSPLASVVILLSFLVLGFSPTMPSKLAIDTGRVALLAGLAGVDAVAADLALSAFLACLRDSRGCVRRFRHIRELPESVSV